MPGFEESNFIDLSKREANHLMCSICMNIFDNAMISGCGHSFCKGCVQQWIDYKHKECPKCKAVFTRKRGRIDENMVIITGFVFRPNFTANGIISELKTKCEFNGCQEVLEFGLLSSHLKTCEHRLCSDCGLEVGPPGAHKCVVKVIETVLQGFDTQTPPALQQLIVTLRSPKSSQQQQEVLSILKANPQMADLIKEGKVRGLKFNPNFVNNCAFIFTKSGAVVAEDRPSDESGASGKSAATSRQESIHRCVGDLIHAILCSATNCGKPSCSRMKRVVQHAKHCKRKPSPPPTCAICKQLLALCCYHAKTCTTSLCPVPYCTSIKLKLRKELQQSTALGSQGSTDMSQGSPS